MLLKLGANRPTNLGLIGHDYPEVWGIYVGMGCVSAESPLEWRGIWAHAHNDVEDEWYGWLCFDKPSRVLTKTGRPTQVLLHEIAHLRVPGQHHTKKWRQTLTLMGGRREAEKYERKPHEKKSTQTECGSAPVTHQEAVSQEQIKADDPQPTTLRSAIPPAFLRALREGGD